MSYTMAPMAQAASAAHSMLSKSIVLARCRSCMFSRWDMRAPGTEPRRHTQIYSYAARFQASGGKAGLRPMRGSAFRLHGDYALRGCVIGTSPRFQHAKINFETHRRLRANKEGH